MTFLSIGLRPFFLGASIWSLVSMGLWMSIYIFPTGPRPSHNSPANWHAHEMIFGYGLAVIAGFLLTAVPNWTRGKTPVGKPLLGLFLLWATARILPFAGDSISSHLIAVVDILFAFALAVAISRPILKAKQWGNLVILAQLAILTLSNALYYAGHVREGLYLGFYAIIAVVFIISRRILPMFISKGVGYAFQPRHHKWVDKSSLIVFLLFAFADTFDAPPLLVGILSSALFVMHSLKLIGWYTPGIWRKPLLWVLFVAYAITVLGFAIKPFSIALGSVMPQLATHAFAIGGIGMMTIGIMSRVSLGHTGRAVSDPPKALTLVFILMLCSAIVRVVFPLIDMSHYITWVAVSQTLWMASFAVLLAIYAYIWVSPDRK